MSVVHILRHEYTGECRETVCGLRVGSFSDGDYWIEAHLAGAHLADTSREPCPVCFPQGRPKFGAPLSELSGRPGTVGYAEFCRIARSWGRD